MSLDHVVFLSSMRYVEMSSLKLLSVAGLTCVIVFFPFTETSVSSQALEKILNSNMLAQLQTEKLARTQKNVYKPGEPIVVEFSGLPGYETDWITIVSAAVSDTTYNEWYYTDGKQSGYMTFKGLSAGTYEVRVYFNWSEGGYKVRDRYRFIVSNN
jgi:hypothetical protein